MCAGPWRLREFHHPNVNHAYPVADSFTLLKRGQSMGSFDKADTSKEAVRNIMAGGAEMKKVKAEMEGTGGPANVAVGVHRSALSGRDGGARVVTNGRARLTGRDPEVGQRRF